MIIEAAWYCESRNEKYIQFNPVKVRCNEAIRRLSKGEISEIPDGSFASIIHSGKYEKFLTVKQVKVKSKKGTWVTETRIRPHVPEIQQEIKSTKIENLDNGEERLARIDLTQGDTVNRRRSVSDSVLISDSVRMEVGYANRKK